MICQFCNDLLFIYYLFKILKTIQSRTPYKRGAEVKRIPCIQNLFTKSTKEQEPRGHPTSASNVAWIIVNYSSTRVNWPLLALYDLGVDSHPPIFGKQCYG